MKGSSILGGCYCGAVRYALVDRDYLVVNCHCSQCRRSSAAPFVTWLCANRESFRFTAGKPKMLVSSEKGRRYFCAECGTPLIFTHAERPEDIDVTTGSLDQPELFAPTRAVHSDNRLPWLPATATNP